MRPRLHVLLLGLAAAGLLACASLEGARHYRDGSHALERGELAKAIGELEHAAVLLPQASEVRNHLGIAYLEAGRGEDALREFEEALALDCTNEAARRNLQALRETQSEDR